MSSSYEPHVFHTANFSSLSSLNPNFVLSVFVAGGQGFLIHANFDLAAIYKFPTAWSM